MRIAWERMLSIIVIAPTMYFVLSLVSAMIPYEEAPRVEFATDGTTVCVIQSLREAVLWPVGIVLFFSLVSVCPETYRELRVPTFWGVRNSRRIYRQYLVVVNRGRFVPRLPN